MKENIIQFNSDIAKGEDEVRIAFYANIGFFIEVAQIFEFNLRKLICYEMSVKEIEEGDITKERIEKICAKYDKYYYDTYSKKLTLGMLIKKARKKTSISEDNFSFLEKLNDFRVNIVHKIFQNNTISHNLGDAELVREYTQRRIVPMTDEAIVMNENLKEFIYQYRDKLRSYKMQVGLLISE